MGIIFAIILFVLLVLIGLFGEFVKALRGDWLEDMAEDYFNKANKFIERRIHLW